MRLHVFQEERSAVVKKTTDFIRCDLDLLILLTKLLTIQHSAIWKKNLTTVLTICDILVNVVRKLFVKVLAIGDWMNMFTVSQSILLDDKYQRGKWFTVEFWWTKFSNH